MYCIYNYAVSLYKRRHPDSPFTGRHLYRNCAFGFDLLCYLAYAGGLGVLQYWHGTSTKKRGVVAGTNSALDSTYATLTKVVTFTHLSMLNYRDVEITQS